MGEIYTIIRTCHKCGKSMNWMDFIAPLYYVDILNQKKTFKEIGIKMLQEIWKNDIFVIECCWCFKLKPSRSKVIMR